MSFFVFSISPTYFKLLKTNLTENNKSDFTVSEEYIITVEPQLSEPHGRHTIRSDNRGVRIDEGNRNPPSMGYRVGDN